MQSSNVRLVREEPPLIGADATNMVNELISNVWEFSLHYGCHQDYCEIKGNCWEADFTRIKSNGLFDNHESGYGETPDLAIERAFDNIKNGKRLHINENN